MLLDVLEAGFVGCVHVAILLLTVLDLLMCVQDVLVLVLVASAHVAVLVIVLLVVVWDHN